MLKLYPLLFLFVFYLPLSGICQDKLIPTYNSETVFKENKGQVHDQNFIPRNDILFSGKAGDLIFHLNKTGLQYQLFDYEESQNTNTVNNKNRKPVKIEGYRIDISWVGTNSNPKVFPESQKDYYDNYYTSVCPNGALNVRSYNKVTYKNIYPDIDAIFHNKNNELNYDFVVNPGGNYSEIKIKVDGANKLVINEIGDVVIETPLGIIVESHPIIYQKEKRLKSKWSITDNILSFIIEEEYDPNYPIIIDPPVRCWGTYLGGGGNEEGFGCVVDSSDNVYLVGQSISVNNIATTGAFQTTLAGGVGYDAFITKFNSAGARIWGTYYGGTADDGIMSGCIDKDNDLIVAGYTFSNTVMATAGAHQTVKDNQEDAFLAKFDSTGTRLWSTYYGGNIEDRAECCTSDKNGDIYITGWSNSSNNIDVNALHQNTHNGNEDAFLAKFTSNGVCLWGTYYGGNGKDNGFSCSVDTSLNIYIAGSTRSSSLISTPSSFQPTYGGGNNEDGFFAKFDNNGILLWGSYLGNTSEDMLTACVLDGLGSLYIYGFGGSTSGISTPNSYQPSLNGAYDSYLLKFDTNGSRIWGTYYGGSSDEYSGRDLLIDLDGNIVIPGQTLSTNGIATTGAYQGNKSGNFDAFIAKFDTTGNIIWGSYYGGNGRDDGYSVSMDTNGSIYMGGRTYSTSINSISTTNSHQPSLGGIDDAFLIKFYGSNSIDTIYGETNLCYSDSGILYYVVGSSGINNYSWSVPFESSIISGQGTDSILVDFGNNSGNITLTYQNSCGGTDTSSLPIIINPNKPNTTIVYANDSICIGDTLFLTASGGTSYLWSTGDTTSTIFVSPQMDSVYTVTVSDNACDSTTPPLYITVNPTFLILDTNRICLGDSLLINGVWESTQGLYVDSLNSINGCDSVISTMLYVDSSYSFSDMLNICQGDSAFLQGAYQNLPGTYYDTLQAINSCDSIIITNLIVDSNTYSSISIIECNTYTSPSGNHIWTSTGTYLDSLINSDGCDSIITINLIINSTTFSTTNTTSCNSYSSPSGNYIWTSSGVYQDTLINLSGCDSVLTINLTIKVVNVSITNSSPTLTSNSSGSEYQWIDCETMLPLIGDTNQIFTATQSGSYALILTQYGCVDTSSCEDIVIEIPINIPNTITPNGDGHNDAWVIDNIGQFPNHTIAIYNRNGSIVFESKDYKNDWEGTYKGNELPATTYYYVVDLGIGDGVLKGDLTIIRE